VLPHEVCSLFQTCQCMRVVVITFSHLAEMQIVVLFSVLRFSFCRSGQRRAAAL
jgi:hypothetical protein